MFIVSVKTAKMLTQATKSNKNGSENKIYIKNFYEHRSRRIEK